MDLRRDAGPSARALPADLNAERATLGAILLDREAIVAVAPWLTAAAFYLERHAWIYDACLACYHQRVPPELSTVADELRRRDRLEPIGGLAFLGELAAEVPTAVHVEYYAQIVERTATLRRLIEAGGAIAALGYDERAELETTLDQAEATLFAVSQRRAQAEFVPLGTVIDTLYSQITARQAERGAVIGVATGYRDLDALLGGLQPADLIILAARPATGKTALALAMAYQAALRQQARVGIFSLEMSREQLGQRLLALHTGVDVQRLRTGVLSEHELARVLDAMGVLAELPIFIEDTPGLSVTDIRSRARRLHAAEGLDLLLVDYLQLLSGGQRAENRVQEVSAISRGLKHLARELNVPLLAISQLSRAVEGRASHLPLLSDLRESGSLEQDADVVLFIYREELYDRDTDKQGLAEIHIAKHRNGPIGVAPLHFDAATTRFFDLERYRVER